MSKFNDLTRSIKKYHFWVLAGVMLVVMLATWWIATASIDRQYEQYKSQYAAAKQQMETLARTENHPNPAYEEGNRAAIDGLRRSVADAWRLKYEKQGDQLRWPAELGADFKAAIERLLGRDRERRPIESVAFPTPRSQELPINLRERYANFIQRELPKLAEKIGAEWNPSGGMDRRPGGTTGLGFGRGSGFGGDEGADEAGARPAALDASVLVEWSSRNQSELLQHHFDWSMQTDRVPTTLQVLYAQEDLWVLESLIDIIARTNAGADNITRPVPVRGIEQIQIGRQVDKPAGRTMRLGGAEAESPPGDEGGFHQGTTYQQDALEGPAESMLDEAGQPLTSRTADPAEGRYVDLQYRPLSAQALRNAARSDSAADAHLAVAKRIPVRMQLIVDERELNKLLIECANSPLTVEVRQVRMSYLDGGTATPGGDAPRGGMPLAGVSAAEATRSTQPRPYDVRVEIYGIVSVFNPANIRSLGLETAEADEAPADAPPSPPTAPAPPSEPPAAVEPPVAEPEDALLPENAAPLDETDPLDAG